VGRWGHVALLALVALLLASPASATRAAARDDTAWLQAKLDAGGNVFLPKLANGQCYATRGLWVSRDDTSITSDGACIVALGPSYLPNPLSPRPLRANAVFSLDHSNVYKSLPARVTVSGVHIIVPAATKMDGVSVFGGEVSLDRIAVSGAPVNDVLIGAGRLGSGGASERISVTGSTLTGARRDAIAAYGPIDLRLDGNGVSGARSNGIDIIAADRGQPILNVSVTGNTVENNRGAGIVVDADPAKGGAELASGIDVSGNRVLANARSGIVLAGGQEDGAGQLTVTDNVVRRNHGAGIRGLNLRFALTSSGNDLRGNSEGATKGLRVVAVASSLPGATWTPSARTLATAGHDDTSWLQQRLDARGGTIFLPKLPNGTCYATRGLWISHDNTTITSDGACIVSLGPGPTRLHSADGDPISSTAVLYVSRSNPKKPSVVGVTISNLQIVVPAPQGMFGVAAYGHRTTLSHVDIEGSPIDDVLIGGRGNGNGYVANVSVLASTLAGADRNAISAFGVIGLQIEGNTIEGVRDSPPGQPAAGIDVEPDERYQPTLDVHILKNLIADNAGPGILFPLDTNSGPSLLADELEISGNTILRNAHKTTPPTRAGVALEGGQDGGKATMVLANNVIRDNGGPGILTRALKFVLEESGNVLSGNEDG
jgi:Right handed beta helix region